MPDNIISGEGKGTIDSINYFCCCTLLFTNDLFSGMVSAIYISSAFNPQARAKQGGHHLLAPLECVNIGRGSLFPKMVEHPWCDQEMARRSLIYLILGIENLLQDFRDEIAKHIKS